MSPKMKEGEANLRCLYGKYKRSSKLRGIIFLLTLEDFRVMTKQNCFYCGIEPLQIQGGSQTNGDWIYNGIDKINPKLGYILENCVACCKHCNRAKWLMSHEEFIIHIKRIHKFLNL